MKKLVQFAVSVGFLSLLPIIASCSSAVTILPNVHWTYEGAEGPSRWAELSPNYAPCSAGKKQSPIDLHAPVRSDLANLVFHYQPSKLNALNNGHTVQQNYDAGSYIEIEGVRYDLLQFHVHTPSEHALDGKLTELEIHFVHKSAAGQLAVVGVFVEEGGENTAAKPLWDHLSALATSGATFANTTELNAIRLLPSDQTTFRYDGSLTTPPCTEGVKWNVMVKPIEMSKAQIAALHSVLEGNNRPLQPLNGRTLTEDSTP